MADPTSSYRRRETAVAEMNEREAERRRAPVQSSLDAPVKGWAPRPAGTVAWWEHLAAWVEYAKKHSGQDAERIAERGGFSYYELTLFLGRQPVSWTPRA